ncbi:exonuclease SbcCD subunit D [Candidatus Woesearchaeota archaeon]|nr:exonuclease SbcCD subunit D [Candidatus Woesearchaeota archaeon]
MKFAHLSDCHIGSWQRTTKLADASITAFIMAMDTCISEKVDFILISGDLFDTAIPAVDKLKDAVHKLKEVRDKGISAYVIAGSHDYSPTGKTMLEVLEKADLFQNVYKATEQEGKLTLQFTTDPKTGAKITGILGKKGGLEKNRYAELKKEDLEKEGGFKIFMLHSGIEEYKPKHLEQMEAVPLEWFPKGFDYYAAGHIHYVFSKKEPGYGLIAFPGPLYPNSFDELERIGNGGFYIVETQPEPTLRHVPLMIHNFLQVKLDCDGKTSSDIEAELRQAANKKELVNTVVGIRLEGKLKAGKTTDIDFKQVFGFFYSRGAHCVLKNTSALTSEYFEEVKVKKGSIEDVEAALIEENSGQTSSFTREEEKNLVKSLMEALSIEKEEGERQADFERRVIERAEKLLGIGL